MSGLGAALIWYQKKIGAYDKQLWERSVEQHILRNVDELPKKSAKLKPELIDVDLVRGSTFPKAKPQKGWIATTTIGVWRVLLLPIYCSWWKRQTSKPVCFGILVLYFLQIGILYLYFTAKDDFQDVSTYEVMTPIVMMIVLGVVHSQIVATVSSKNSHKSVCRSKRKRLKRKYRIASETKESSKSSPETASEEKLNGKAAEVENVDSEFKSQIDSKEIDDADLNLPVRKNSDEESGLDSLDFAQSNDIDAQTVVENHIEVKSNAKNPQHSHGDENRTIKDVDHYLNVRFFNSHRIDNERESSAERKIRQDENLPDANSGKCENRDVSNLKKEALLLNQNDINSSSINYDKETAEASSGEEYFVAARHKRSNLLENNSQQDHSHHSTPNHRRRNSVYGNKLRSSAERQIFPLYWRRFSDFGNKTERLPPSLIERSGLASTLRRLSEGCSLNRRSVPRENPSSSSVSTTKRLNQGVPLMTPNRGDPLYSSCESDGDTTPTTPNKPQTSDMEWPIITNTDCNSDSTDSAVSDQDDGNVSTYEGQTNLEENQEATGQFLSPYSGSDKDDVLIPHLFHHINVKNFMRIPIKGLSCAIWERNECKKVDLTVLDISSAIVVKVDSLSHSSEYLIVGLLCAFILAFLPVLFRLNCVVLKDETLQDVASEVVWFTVPTPELVTKLVLKFQEALLGSSFRSKIVVCGALLERFTLSAIYFFLLAVAERTFKQRFLYAKHFCHLTSARRARRSELPHFRLNKVRNIKTWLSVRSYLKKHGPERSVDVIVSTAFVLIVCLLSFLCLQLLKGNQQFVDRLYCWEIVFWCIALGLFLMRFMILGTKINKKYRNLSALTTEQINLYLHMEQKPHKKEELMLANNVLKLAIDLLKELEGPFKISGLRANPYLYNVTKVVVLSAFSAVLTELLGFKLKLYNIKIK